MAVEFTLQNGRWSPGALKKFLEAWAPTSPIPLLSWSPWAATAAGLRTWLFGEGAIRGVHIVRRMSLVKGASITVRLNAMASRADWIVAYAFLRGLVQGRGGRVLGPGERVMRAEHLTEDEAASDAQTTMFDDARSIAERLRAGEQYALFPNPEFDMLVSRSMLPVDQDPARFAIHLGDELREMADRYQRAASVPVGTLPNGRTLAVWSMDDALLPWTDYIGVRQGPEAEEGVVFRAARAMELLGPRLEVAAESMDRFFLAAVDSADEMDRKLGKNLLAEGTPIAEFLAQFQRQGRRA